jgi:hypothetical protein
MGMVKRFLAISDLKSRCPNGEEHRWRKSGDVRASAGDNIVVNFTCTKCNKRTSAFLTGREYQLYEKQLKEVGNG